MPPSNNKKRKLALANQPAELIFDPNARQEYLTGFHKRKVARKEHARDVAIKREKEEKVVARKQMRDQRKQDLETHIAEFNAELRKQNPDIPSEAEAEDSNDNDDGDGFQGFPSPPPSDKQNQESEYVDEDKYTTVTVSAMDAEDASADELAREDAAKAAAAKIAAEKKAREDEEKKKKRPWTKERPSDGRPKAKKKKFRYESKYERKETRAKQKAKNAKAAKARKGE